MSLFQPATEIETPGRQRAMPRLPDLLLLLATAVCLLAWWQGPAIGKWAFDYPRAWQIPAARHIGEWTKWLVNDASFGLFNFTDLTRFIADLIDIPYRLALSLLSTGFLSGQGSAATQLVPPISFFAVIALAGLAGLHAGGLRLAVLVAACFGFIAIFGQWTSAMVTLASILVAVPIGVVLGLLLGLAGYRWPWVERALTPLLDLMQTIPIFAYLVPILFFFGFGPTAAIVGTVIYALPPMVRITIHGLRAVPSELRDLGHMVGCSHSQMTWKVMIPSAADALMVGVNQVIMLSLNMVIIASMIGAGGLGFDVLAALRRLDIGAGLEAGFAIVALAIALDRLSQAFARKAGQPVETTRETGWLRSPYLAGSLGLLAAGLATSLLFPPLARYPEQLVLSTGVFWNDVVQWININFFDTIEATRTALLLNLLVPVKRFLGELPWIGVVALLAATGYRLGGLRLAVTVGGLSLLVAATGQWEKAMVTVYLCGIAVVIASIIGIPLGILAAERERLWRGLQVVIDTLQTLPSFVYLMPAVMLFRVGDFTALIAIVAYAVAPAIRYTVLGLQRVDPQVLEAARSMGCTPVQILIKVKLRLALPELLLGLNQTIMFALSMLVITALVGTRDLGQEVYIALTKADTGRGLVAGLAVAFIAIIADRLISAGAARLKEQTR
ncbi:glycine betaine/proline transport system permease protein [Peteryoungia aggregata LMG 23059]|uniref:Glycine betaine/proline transport system permease protein n=1 Tax=Peteryoungia aggregata LMG 23059 TaxID=1368425 RepID=A0ABU0GBS8_9HYPH|nr:ABC transporter permease subunit [Peteryoungia aggregata]MDQ0422810.1 glycine betaine/proline transport system permease protein [Peteryoungia aggregata LMG 23059]